MGLLDVFRPRWKHSNPAIRMEALKTLEDDEALAQAASHDSDERIRRVAIRQMIDPWRLKNVAHVQSDEKLRAMAQGRARELFVEIALSSREAERSALSAVRDLDSQEHLADIAVKATRPAVRTQALDLVVTKGALVSVIKRATDPEIRKAALLRLTDVPALKHLAIAERDLQFAALILEGIKDNQALMDVAQRARHKAVAKLARQRCQPAAHEVAQANAAAPEADLEGRRRHARQYQLAREAEGLAERAVAGSLEDEVAAQEMETEWSRINQDADLEVKLRFERALQRFAKLHGAASEARRKAEQKQASARTAAKVRELTQRMAEPQTESAPPSESAPQTSDATSGDAGGEAPDDKIQREANRPGLSPEALEGELQALRVLQAQLQEALSSESLRTLDGAVRQARSAEKRVSRLPETERETMSAAFGNLKSDLLKRLSDAEQREAWKRWANVKRFETLCQQAEVLRDVLVDFPDKEQGPKELANLRAAWRKLGPVPASKRNELWIRFKTACEAVMDIVQAHRTAEARPEDSDAITLVRQEDISSALQADDVTVIRSQLELNAEPEQTETSGVDDVTVISSPKLDETAAPQALAPSQSDDVTVIASPQLDHAAEAEEKDPSSSDDETQVDHVERLT